MVAYLKVSRHCLSCGWQKQLGRKLDAARQLVTFLHGQHQICLRLRGAHLPHDRQLTSPQLSIGVFSFVARHDERSCMTTVTQLAHL